MNVIQVDIIGLSTSPSSGGAYALVLGEVGGNRRLPIIIGPFEAQAIAIELEKVQPARPMTHDLLRDIFETVDADVSSVIIDDLREGTFYAKIRYVVNGKEQQLDARPSDAVALAVRCNAAIYVVSEILDEAGIPADDDDGPDEMSLPEEAVSQSMPRTRLEQMQAQLEKAILDEDYEKAAELRDEIERARHEN